MSGPGASPPEILVAPERGDVLVLAPHADDDVIGCGGTAWLHARQGDKVRVLVAFDGAAGVPPGVGDRTERAKLRRREALSAGAHLGIGEYVFWDYPEGHEPGPGELAEAVRRLVDLVGELAPATVYAPWIGEHHTDHRILARAARVALELARFDGRVLGYEVWTPLEPTRVVDVTPALEAKRAALREHASQSRAGHLERAALGLSAHRALYLPDGATHGEAFAPLGTPDASDRVACGLEAGR